MESTVKVITEVKDAARESNLDEDLHLLMLLKAEREHIEAQVREVQERVTDSITKMGRKSYTVATPGRRLVATVVRPTRMEFNEDGLKKALGTNIWSKVTVVKLDTKKLQDAIGLGFVDPTVVATYATEKFSTPYVKITEKADVNDAEVSE